MAEENILRGKHIIYLGSSVTYGFASDGISFADFISQRNGTTFTKEAVSGTTLVDEGPDSYISRMKTIKDPAADLFICQLSTNDATLQKPFGYVSSSRDISTFDTKTIAGAMEYIIAYARETWNCPVVFYTSPRYDSREYQQMVDLLYVIREKWTLPVIDMWNDLIFNHISEEDRARYMQDPIHPLRAGYLEWWTPYMEQELREILNILS